MPRFACNIDSKGRRIRLAITVACFIGAAVVWFTLHQTILSLVLLGCGLFGLFEVSRGWCALKAMGIKLPW